MVNAARQKGLETPVYGREGNHNAD